MVDVNKWAAERWVSAVNADGSYGKWACEMVRQVSVVNVADYVMEYRNTKLAALEVLRKSLLHQAFNGEL